MPTGDFHEVAEAARAINGILTPTIMISASALLILALQGKYSNLIDRLRDLNEERRRHIHNEGQSLSPQRLANVVDQIEVILLRARLVRNSVMSLYIAITTFIASSIAIGARLTLGVQVPVGLSLVVFMFGMIFVLGGTLYAVKDITKAYTVARLEVRGAKGLKKEIAEGT